MIEALRGRVVAPAELSAEERQLWRELCTHPALDHPFYSLTFTECVAQVHPHVRVCILERAGAIEGFLPFQHASGWTRALRAAEPVGHGMSDYFGIIARPTLRLSPADLLTAAGLDALLFDHLPDEQAVLGLTGEQPRTGLRIAVGDDPEGYWQRLKAANKAFAAELERCQRKLEKDFGPPRFHLSVTDANGKLERLIEDKRAQYRATGVSDALASPWKRALLLLLAQTREPDCTGVFSDLHAGKVWAASHFGLRSGHVLHYWFPVYNPTLAKLSPGHTLMRNMIQTGIPLGIRSVDLGEGDEYHKQVWRPESYILHRGLWHQTSLQALAYRMQLATDWRLRRWMRRSARLLGRPHEHPEGKQFRP